ncbi:hypothetical protein [Metaclostridioides mangenotii]|uniref:Uncharacterized protein n=1 Tax=Metaclostridioides mangenotii TaxID=1540 RepID=A0ABS4E6Y5_9FIRM|nr:hypothetical protein [Clostridioides mangenotii]MBP1853707.1 hypothetical protein [Clostridioides mangenotii]
MIKTNQVNIFKDKTSKEIAAIIIQGCFKNFTEDTFSYYYFCNNVAEAVTLYYKGNQLTKEQADEINVHISNMIQELIIKNHKDY